MKTRKENTLGPSVVSSNLLRIGCKLAIQSRLASGENVKIINLLLWFHEQEQQTEQAYLMHK